MADLLRKAVFKTSHRNPFAKDKPARKAKSVKPEIDRERVAASKTKKKRK